MGKSIAVLVYGRLDKCVEHYENILNSIGRDNHIDFFLSSDNSPESLLNDFIKIYNPISYINDKISYTCDLSTYPNVYGSNIDNMIRHFINKGRVFCLLENYIKELNRHYDIVLSIRIDLVFYSDFKFDIIEDNTIYIPRGFDYFGINDQVAYGNIEPMKKYNNIFSNLINLLNNKCIPHPESLTQANIIFNKLFITRVDISYVIEK
jgi:hypothetical protein